MPRVNLTIDGEYLVLDSDPDTLRQLSQRLYTEDWSTGEDGQILVRLNAPNALVLRWSMVALHASLDADEEDLTKLATLADKVPSPSADLSKDGKRIVMDVPYAKAYTTLMRRMGAYQRKGEFAWTVDLSKMMSLEMSNSALRTMRLPEMQVSKRLHDEVSGPLPGFDGTLDSLRDVPVSALSIVANDVQTYRNRKQSSKTLTEKMEDFGLPTLYDLLFYRPRRFVDKSEESQSLQGLMEKESATVLGTIVEVSEMFSGKGVNILVDIGEEVVRAQFFRQNWLASRFHAGDEVVITGKVNLYRGQRNLTGQSIEDAHEAQFLPVVPVYKQSPSKGLTTAKILAMVRELLTRAGTIQLPPYLPEPKSDLLDSYTQALWAAHFPANMDQYFAARDYLASLELIMLQVIVQSDMTVDVAHKGLMMPDTSLQEEAVSKLPYTLTGAQQKGIARFNEVMATDTPGSFLLNAEVGAGKTVVAQAAALTAVGNGYQVVMAAPMETLATQLYQSMLTLTERLDTPVRVEYLASSMTKTQQKKVIKAIAEGEVDVVIGTHLTLMPRVEYKNLGLVIIDEQQKFSVQRRTEILSSRPDGRIPHLITQTATPVPRSAAQTVYGDMEMVILDERPPGRKPIETVWINQPPQDLLDSLAETVWEDIIEEARAGHQTFIFAPFIEDAATMDAASVKTVYESLSAGPLADLRVACVHGKMKSKDQQEVMQGFREKDYDVLVASTVVEVGIDIPDATRVVILSADRLGVSSLHQIRGRVGRNSLPSKCYLVCAPTERQKKTAQRIQAVVDNPDGFSLAAYDLESRGEGQLFGTEQSGESGLVFATLSSHQRLIPRTQEYARRILTATPYRQAALSAARLRFGDNESRRG